MRDKATHSPIATHWGNYLLETEGTTVTAVHPYDSDKNPTPLGQSLLASLDENCRVAQPMVRAGYLEHGVQSDRSGRGREPFVAVEWEQAWDLAATALERVCTEFGNQAIYAGSYGWGSKAVEQLTGMIPNLKAEVLAPVISKGFPREEDYLAHQCVAH